ncbi:MAG: hypothetical protein QOJ75_1151, partial [Chloroflexota bacterium]|nr:hypothetical protein [Chloroflexota bacterium]
WANVKAAVAGASIVIYMGHGNGWPSPYGNDAAYTTKDGFGLNASAGAGDYNNVYYGEPAIATLALAPGAIVILNHLCYASGNSEPGNADPSVSVARQRVDNYAAAFLRAGAGAVIADGHGSPVGYLRDLFTTNQSLESLWANQSNANGNAVSFPSVRTPGASAFQDPETPTSGFYRSLVVRSASSTTGAPLPVDPAATSVAPAPPAPAATPVPPPPAPAGSQLRALSPAAATVTSFSPNGDGYRDVASLTATPTGPGAIAVSVRDTAGTTFRAWTVVSSGSPTKVTWDGRDAAGTVAADGRYVITVAPEDASGNIGIGQDRIVSLVTGLGAVATSSPVFYPQDLDQLAPTTTLSFNLARPMTVTWTLRDATARIVDTHLAAVALDAGTQTWVFDGRRSDGTMLPAGRYLSYVAASDGSVVVAQSVSFEADAFLIKPSDVTPGRGQAITLTVTSAEPLAANPRLLVYQPGFSARAATVTQVSDTIYLATIRLRTGAGTGTVTFRATGRDLAGATQQTTRAYPLH